MIIPVSKPNNNKIVKSRSSSRPQTSSQPYVTGQMKTSINTNKGNFQMNPIEMAVKGAEVYSNLPPEVKKGIKEGVKNRMNKYSNPSGRGSSNHSSGYALTDSPQPKEIRLDTGIQPNTYVADQMEAVYQQCSPLHMTCVQISIPQTAGSQLYTTLIDQVFHLQTAAQSNVGFALNVATDFAQDRILVAMNALVYSLQIYFYYKSIISYFSNPANNNRGMITLRRNLTPQLLEDLTLLERRLLDTPIPPNLLEYMRYLSGTYYSGNTAGAPLIKICPIAPNISGVDLTTPSTALAQLSVPNNNTVFTLLRRAVPQWLPSVLYDVPPEPFYDDNFKTIFANLPSASFYNGVTNYFPTVSTAATPIQYNSFTEVLDGAAFCLVNFNITGTPGWQPGLISPLGTGLTRATSSRISYYVDSSNLNNGFYGSDLDPYLTRSRPDTYQVNDAANAYYAIHLPGAQICQIVSSNTVRETSINVIEYLFSLGSVKKPKNDFVSASSGRRTKRK